MAPRSSTLPGESHGQRSLAGYSPWRRKELDTAERLHFHLEKFRDSKVYCVVVESLSHVQLFMTP